MVTARISGQAMGVSKTQRSSRRPAKISLNKAMNLFFDRDDEELKQGTRQEYDNALLLLEMYIDTFGSVMLRAAGATPTLARPKSGPPCKRYDPASLAIFFRGFVLFFLQFKVRASNEIKETLTRIIEEFIEWLRAKGHLPKEFQSNFEEADVKSTYLALHVRNILERAIEHSAQPRKMLENIHDSEPVYVVSQVKSGKCWFIHLAEGDRYDEFGPVSVPRGVSDILKPGWLVDGVFGKFDGKWQITTVRSILPM